MPEEYEEARATMVEANYTIDDGQRHALTMYPALAAFIPFGTFLVYVHHQGMPLKWVSLASSLQFVSLFSIYVNITTNDLLWSMLGIFAFVAVCAPVYLNIVKTQRVVDIKTRYDEITFANLFKVCSSGVFSEYRISLLAKTPLALQALAGGSVLYKVFGVDWIFHALAGFGVGALATKAYITAVNHYGYNRLASYFRLDRFHVFKVEHKTGSAEFTLFSLIVVELIWELCEIVVCLVSPVNVYRIEAEPLWNRIGDIVFAIAGGMSAWYLLKCKLKWL